MIQESKIKQIMQLSLKLGNDSNKIISMMQNHAQEIKELYDSGNKHFAVETGDLIILCMQLLIMEGYSVDEIMEKGYLRFDKKLNELLNDG